VQGHLDEHAGLALDVAPVCVDCPAALPARNATLHDFMGAQVDGVHWLNFLD
jgi:hypothetical protein